MAVSYDEYPRQSEHPLAQPVVALERRRRRLRRLDQVLDDGRRNVVAVKRGVERRTVPARLREEPVALEHAVVERGVGIDRDVVQLVELREGVRSIGLVPVRREHRAVLAVGERHRPRPQLDGREPHVGRRQRGIGVVGRRREPARERQQVLPLVVEHVLLLAVEVFQREAVHGEVRPRVHPRLHGGERNLEQLGVEPGARLAPLREQDLHLLPLRVHGVVALVLVVPQRGVVPDLVFELADRVGRHERRDQRVGA